MFPSGGSPAGGPPEEAAEDAELIGCSKEELVRRLRREESERVSALLQRGRLMRGVNRQLQEHLREVRELKAANGRLSAENAELRELCLFLDEDRLKARRLCRHWQLFGHHSARVLREEVQLCLAKLRALEGLQHRLAQENAELRELCLALDLRCGASELGLPCGARDLGDGSSSTGSLGSPDQALPPPDPEAGTDPDGRTD